MTRRVRNASFEDSLQPDPSGCLLWIAAHTKAGYGNYKHPITKRNVVAHVYAWELVNGPVPDGYQLHHECHVRSCCLPAHLKPVTSAEHRQIHGAEVTQCPQGHPYDEENTRVMTWGNGLRSCKACHRDQERERRARVRQ